MNCDDCQNRISELLDAGPSAPLDPVAEQHLADCPACREFRDASAALDAQLVHHTPSAVLPADFKTTLLARLPVPRVRLTPAEIAARRAQLEFEYREALAALDRRYLVPHAATILRLLPVAAAWVFGGLLLVAVMDSLPAAIEDAFGQAAAVWTIALLSGGGGLAAAFYSLRRTGALRHLRLGSFRKLRFTPRILRGA